jgi:hypothetical protein
VEKQFLLAKGGPDVGIPKAVRGTGGAVLGAVRLNHSILPRGLVFGNLEST